MRPELIRGVFQFWQFLRERVFRPLPLAIVVAGVLGAFIASREFRYERKTLIRAEVSQTAAVLAAQVAEDLEEWSRNLKEIGEARLKPLYRRSRLPLSGTQDAPGEADSTDLTSSLELDRQILDVELWGKGEEGKSPRRLFSAFNAQHLTPSQMALLRAESLEASEAERIEPAFRGSTFLFRSDLSADLGGRDGVGTFVVPLGRVMAGPAGGAEEVLVAHFRLSTFRGSLRWNGKVRVALVSNDGALLASEGQLGGSASSLLAHPLFTTLQKLGPGRETGIAEFVDGVGNRMIGASRQVPFSGLAILASIPENPFIGAAGNEGSGSWIFGFVCALSVLLGFWIRDLIRFERIFHALKRAKLRVSQRMMRASSSRSMQREAPSAATPSLEGLEGPSLELGGASADMTRGMAKRRVVIVLHASVKQVHELLEAVGTESAVSALSDFLGAAAARIRECGGEFEKDTGSSFVAVWGVGQTGVDDASKAIQCALELRSEFVRFSEAQGAPPERALELGMGIDAGLAIAGRLGTDPDERLSVIGEVLTCARKLDSLSSSARTDLLVSAEAWAMAHGRFQGEQAGEASLAPGTDAKRYYRVSGVLDSLSGAEISPSVPEELTTSFKRKPDSAMRRWWVNNGSQIVGPLSGREIAGRLFAQELDFDSECWLEGSGKPSQIRDCGIFTGSDVPEADLWIFDGEEIHGPFTEGFLRTAWLHHAVSKEAFVCSKSTIQGWKPLPTLFEKPSAPSASDGSSPTSEQKEPMESEATPSESQESGEPQEIQSPVETPPSAEVAASESTEPSGSGESQNPAA